MKELSIAVVTPSFNQGRFLRAAIRSVLDQRVSGLDYAVVDGGSSDDSPEIISSFAAELAWHASSSDAGQYDAINKGFGRIGGNIMGWLNSDDLHCPWTLGVVRDVFMTFPEVEWLTTRFPLRWDDCGWAVHCAEVRGYSRRGLEVGEHLPGTRGFFTAPIQQESTFWRRELWDRTGGAVSLSFGPAGDYELWCRFAKSAELYAVSTPLAGFRQHGDQQTVRAREAYFDQARRAHSHHFGETAAGFRARLRPIARDRVPVALHPVLRRLGLLHPARVITRARDNSAWQITRVLV